MKFKKEMIKREGFELCFARIIEEERVKNEFEMSVNEICEKERDKKALVQVKVRNNRGDEKMMFMSVGLNELINVFDEGKLDED